MHFSSDRIFVALSLGLIFSVSPSLHAASEKSDTAATDQLEQQPSPLMMFGGDGVEAENPNSVMTDDRSLGASGNNPRSASQLTASNLKQQQRSNDTSLSSLLDDANDTTMPPTSISPRGSVRTPDIDSSNMSAISLNSSPLSPIPLPAAAAIDAATQTKSGSFGIRSVTSGTDNQMPRSFNRNNNFSSSSSSSEIATGLRAHSLTQDSETHVDRYDHDAVVSAIKDEATQTDITCQQIEAINKAFPEQLKSIEDRKNAQLQVAENRAQMTPERTLASGMPSVLTARSGAKKSAFDKIKAAANHDTIVATFNRSKALAEHQTTLENSLLEKRLIRKDRIQQRQLFSPTEPDEAQDQQTPQIRLQQAQKIRRSTVEFIGDEPGSASDKDLSFALQAFDAADSMTKIALAPSADAEIPEARMQLNTIDYSLNALAESDLPSKNRFSSRATIAKIQQNFHEADASFLLAQTHSDTAAKMVADDHARYFFKEAEKLKTTALESSHEIEHASANDTSSLQTQVETLTQVALILEKAALAYDQIGDACSSETRTLSQDKENFLQLHQQITSSINIPAASETPTTALKQEIATALHSLELPEQPTTPAIETYGFSFLSQLKDLADAHDADAIIGHNGQIVLEPLPSSGEAMTDDHRLSYNRGVNLIRLTLFRDFGSHGVERFDTRFRGKIAAQNPLKLCELRAFMETEKQINTSSYFISSRHSIEELLGASVKEDPSEDAKIIKSDDTATPFNPFLNMPVSELADEKKSTERGITATKKELERYLTTQKLDPHRIRSIVAHFEHQFSDSKNQLTVGALKSFLDQEEQQTSFDWHTWLKAPPQDIQLNNALWHATQGVAFVARTHLPFFSAPTLLAGFNTFSLTAALAWVSDLTIDYRRMPTERDEEH